MSDLTQAQQEDVYNMLLLIVQQVSGPIPNIQEYLLPGSPTPVAPVGFGQLFNLFPIDFYAQKLWPAIEELQAGMLSLAAQISGNNPKETQP